MSSAESCQIAVAAGQLQLNFRSQSELIACSTTAQQHVQQLQIMLASTTASLGVRCQLQERQRCSQQSCGNARPYTSVRQAHGHAGMQMLTCLRACLK